MAKNKTRKLKKGEESKLHNASPEFLKQLQEIKKLPDDCFVYLPDVESVTIKLSGQFHNALRLGLEHLMESEESFRVIKALYRVKTNFMDEKGKPIPPNKITNYEVLMWSVMTLTTAITAAGVEQKKSRVADKVEWFKALDKAFKVDKKEDHTAVEALDEVELANRMGLRVDERTGELVIDKEYLKQHDLNNPDLNDPATDILKGRFGIDVSNGQEIDLSILEPEQYPIPVNKQKGMKGKMEKW